MRAVRDEATPTGGVRRVFEFSARVLQTPFEFGNSFEGVRAEWVDSLGTSTDEKGYVAVLCRVSVPDSVPMYYVIAMGDAQSQRPDVANRLGGCQPETRCPVMRFYNWIFNK